jgi:hypothetical protein
MYIFGSECTITLIQNALRTALPYTLETLREEPQETALDPLIGYILPLTTIPTGVTVLGCVVTRVSDETIEPLATLLQNGHQNPFTLLINRIAEKRTYQNLCLTAYEIRANRDEPLYIRFDVQGTEATDWDITTPDILWEQRETLEYTDGDIRIDDAPINGIHRFALTRLYRETQTTYIQLHYALDTDHPLNNRRTINILTLTLGNRLRITCNNLTCRTFDAKTDNAAEILMVRRYRIDGDTVLETRNPKGEWEPVV